MALTFGSPYTRPMTLWRRSSLVTAGVLLSLVLSACDSSFLNCRDTSICPIKDATPNYKLTATFGPGKEILSVAAGQTVTAMVYITRVNLAEDVPLVFAAYRPVAADPLLLSTFDQGRVQIRWNGQAFTGNVTSLTITVAPEATRNVMYSLNDYGAGLLLRKQGDPYNFGLQGILEVK